MYNEEFVSDNVESLVSNVPVYETIKYILNEIYMKNKLSKLCSKLMSRCLLLKLTTESTFMLNSKFYK